MLRQLSKRIDIAVLNNENQVTRDFENNGSTMQILHTDSKKNCTVLTFDEVRHCDIDTSAKFPIKTQITQPVSLPSDTFILAQVGQQNRAHLCQSLCDQGRLLCEGLVHLLPEGGGSPRGGGGGRMCISPPLGGGEGSELRLKIDRPSPSLLSHRNDARPSNFRF